MRKHNKHQQKPRTRRFRKNEAAITNVLFRLLRKHRGRLSVTTLARELHMSRRAFYLHHHDINSAISESEEALLHEFGEYLTEFCPEDSGNTSNRRLITACFIFMSQRQTVFREIGENMLHQHILYRMLEILYPRLQIIWLPVGAPTPTPDSERVDLYLRCTVGILSRWAAVDRCDIGEAEQYIRQMIKLTDEIGSRNFL